MRFRSALPLLAAVIASVVAQAAPALAQDKASSPERAHVARPYASGRAIVAIAPGDRPEATAVIEQEGGDVVAFNRTGGFFVVDTPSDSAAWAEDVEDEGSVLYSEPDWKISVAATTPSDPSWDKLWGLRQIQAPAAWHTSTGANDVVVGVIDSGVDYTHEDLAGQMWVNPNEDPATPGDDDGNGWSNDVHGIDCVNDDGDPRDDNGHGTHVAGTIGAAANNSKGVAGVSWNVKIMALKFLDEKGNGYTSDAIQCLYYAIENGAHLTNNSWGGSGYSKTLHEAIRYAASRDQLFVAAAGNDGLDTSLQPHFPSAYDVDNVISVAASDPTDALAPFSNYGASAADLAAPGTGILSTVPGGYASYSGTSMASPHVAGAAALLLASDTSLRQDVSGLRAAILDNVDPVAGLQGKVATGGRLNLASAMWPERPLSMHVHSVATSTKTLTKRFARVTVILGIDSDREEPVPGAKVILSWGSGGNSSCLTAADGTCEAKKKVLTRSVKKLALEVRSVTHAVLQHDPDADHAS